MKPIHLYLPVELRKELSKPLGELIEGSINETTGILKQKLKDVEWIVGVGDVTAEILVTNNFNPKLIITDGQTKREILPEWKKYNDFKEIKAKCPPAEITIEAWEAIRKAIKLIPEGSRIHLLIEGEEDLLVLPLLIELPKGSKIIYGQPNKGAVIRTVDNESIENALKILKQMNTAE